MKGEGLREGSALTHSGVKSDQWSVMGGAKKRHCKAGISQKKHIMQMCFFLFGNQSLNPLVKFHKKRKRFWIEWLNVIEFD